MTKETFYITINNRRVKARSGDTVLQVARENGITIPSLCDYEHLLPYGGCRLCVVEIEGLRGFPSACTTPAHKGMVVKTETAKVRTVRQEILRLLLSEHPSSCLFCGTCSEEVTGTIRKVGMSTGCRYCPADHHCELQDLAETIVLPETLLPIKFRTLSPERYDPFYDRHYNLCILCGRCVRVCSELRLNGTLTFIQRGPETLIGTAFERSHIDAGCEFCGMCVEACPTGAMISKVGKWQGNPESETTTTCCYCPIGCQLRFETKDNRILDALPNYDSEVDHGLVCVKGRFAIPEYVHHHSRLANPKTLTSLGYVDASWNQALRDITDKLVDIDPQDILFMISPHLSNEDLFVVQEFAREVVGTENIASSIMFDLGDDLSPFSDLVTQSASFETIEAVGSILTFGFDPTYAYSPIGVRIKKAAQAGTRLIVIDDLESSLELFSHETLHVEPSQWNNILEVLSSEFKVQSSNPEIENWRSKLKGLASESESAPLNNLIVVGPKIINAPNRSLILQNLLKLRDELDWKIIIAHPYTNLLGALAMETFSEPITIDLTVPRKVIYLIGETPIKNLPECDYLIYQNALPPAEHLRQPDIMLPTTLFPESIGTIINAESRILQLQQAIEPFMHSKPDWLILCQLADKMDKELAYSDIPSIQNVIRRRLRGFPYSISKIEFPEDVSIEYNPPGEVLAVTTDSEYLLYWEVDQEAFRGIPIADAVPGMNLIGNRELLVINVEDAERLQLTDNQKVKISLNGISHEAQIKKSNVIKAGTLRLVSVDGISFEENPCAVRID